MRRKGQQAENDKTERVTGLGRRTREEIAKWNQMTAKTEGVTGLGRRTREEIAKWNQMTALRFETGGRHQTSPASLRGPIA